MNTIELEEEKIEKGSLTHLKINGADISCIKEYSIDKKELDLLEFTVTIMVDPNKSSIKL